MWRPIDVIARFGRSLFQNYVAPGVAVLHVVLGVPATAACLLGAVLLGRPLLLLPAVWLGSLMFICSQWIGQPSDKPPSNDDWA